MGARARRFHPDSLLKKRKPSETPVSQELLHFRMKVDAYSRETMAEVSIFLNVIFLLFTFTLKAVSFTLQSSVVSGNEKIFIAAAVKVRIHSY